MYIFKIVFTDPEKAPAMVAAPNIKTAFSLVISRKHIKNIDVLTCYGVEGPLAKINGILDRYCNTIL